MTDEPIIPIPPFTGRIYIIEGMIGAGKSSFVDSALARASLVFNDDTEVVVIKESVYFPFLDRFIKDPARMALPFQVCMARDRVETMRTAVRHYNQGRVVLIDRGLPGDIAFAKVHAADGNITAADMGLYFGMLSHAVPDFVPTSMLDGYDVPDGEPGMIKVASNCVHAEDASGVAPEHMQIVYLRTNAEVAFERMQKRGIKEETDGYTAEYFKKLAGIYDEVVGHFRGAWGEERVTTIDYNTERAVAADGTLSATDCSVVWNAVFGDDDTFDEVPPLQYAEAVEEEDAG